MGHCGANICFSWVNSHKPRKTLHNQFPVPLTMHRNCKRHILKSNTPSALHCVYQHGCLQFLSPYYITVLPTRLSTVPFTTLHYSVFASKAVYSSCHNTALQCVRQQGCLQFLSPYCITVCVCQQGCLQFLSPFCITVCVCQQVCLQFMSPYCITVCVCQQGCLQFLSPHNITMCVPARLSAVCCCVTGDWWLTVIAWWSPLVSVLKKTTTILRLTLWGAPATRSNCSVCWTCVW